GPTHDDITSASIAEAFGVALERNAEAEARLRAHYRNDETLLNASRLKMADIPAGATLIDNPISTAPGFRIGNVFVMAGIPKIVEAMFLSFRHELTGGAPVVSRTVSAVVGEGDLAAGLGALQADFPDMDIGSYPYFRPGRIGVSVVIRGTDAARVDEAAAALRDLYRQLGAEPIEGEDSRK
ncbi:MAG: molybdopterin-binding protein, partial [Rhodospirillales bacterium]|nr:molybdopterin-binding protein [Rhodospirillales bacterium]